MKPLRYTFALLLLSVVAAAYVWNQYRSFVDTPLLIPEQGFNLQVARGASVRAVIGELQQKGMTRADWRWRILTRLQPSTIKAGEYALNAGLKPPALLKLLASGEVISYRFTIIEGWTYRQLLEALGRDPVLEKTIPELDGDERVLAAAGVEVEHPEGWFLPETYQFVRGDSDVDILARAHSGMVTELENAWSGRAEDLPLESAYELLILASIVEKESGLEEERADIAGVFMRRLQQGWRLETDPTVIYGIGESYDGDIRRRDLDTDTPYNTYTRFGLPPTPIAMPGPSALQAVAAPADGTAMFFVASGTGGHVFSDTLDEHNAAVRKMLRNKP